MFLWYSSSIHIHFPDLQPAILYIAKIVLKVESSTVESTTQLVAQSSQLQVHQLPSCHIHALFPERSRYKEAVDSIVTPVHRVYGVRWARNS